MQPAKSERYEEEVVTLRCNNPADDGNPSCNVYTWIRKEGDPGDLPNTNTYTFTMDESHDGNYTCTCKNDYDTSDVSNTAEVIFLAGTPPVEASSTSRFILILNTSRARSNSDCAYDCDIVNKWIPLISMALFILSNGISQRKELQTQIQMILH